MDKKQLFERLFTAINRLNKCKPHKHFSNAMQGEPPVMHYIISNNGVTTPSELSNFLKVSSARIAVTLKNLEQKGLLTREIDRDDRRRIQVKLTQKGMEFAKQKKENMYSHAQLLFDELGDHDSEELIRIMERVVDIESKHFANEDTNK